MCHCLFSSRRAFACSLLASGAAIVCGLAAWAQQTKPAAPATQPAVADKLVYLQMTTSKGVIVLELNNEKAPISVKNFLAYTEKEFYNNTIFHRVMPNFMVQGGGFGMDKAQKATGAPIKNEWQNGLKNVRGSIAMARTGEPDSATAQFFINVVDNANLDQPISGGAGYAVFGKVVAGMKVVDAIVVVPTHNEGGHGNWPNEPVILQKMEKIDADAAKKLIEADKGAAH